MEKAAVAASPSHLEDREAASRLWLLKRQKHRASVAFLVPRPYRDRHAHASVRLRVPTLVSGSQSRLAGARTRRPTTSGDLHRHNDVRATSIFEQGQPKRTDASSPREGCVRMARETAKSMDQSSFWVVNAAGPPGKLASADHGFPGTRRNVTVPVVSRVHPGNVG